MFKENHLVSSLLAGPIGEKSQLQLEKIGKKRGGKIFEISI